jgi:hypothetical protein
MNTQGSKLVHLPVLKRFNFRIRLGILCALFIAPLCLLFALQISRARDDFSFLERELRDVAVLQSTWPDLLQAGRRDERQAVEQVHASGRAVILDPYSETYHLANALTSTLPRLAMGAGEGAPVTRARLAHQAADDLSEAADNVPRGAMRQALAARAARLNQFAALTTPVASESAQMWRATADDLEHLLRQRRAEMINRMFWGVLLVGGFTALGVALAVGLARGLSRRIGLLVAQIDRLIDNDTSQATPLLDDRHDLGRIAQGVDALRYALIDARAAWSQVLLNEMRCALLTEHSPSVVLLTDPAGIVAFTSPSCTGLEFEPEAIEATSIWDLFAAADGNALRDGVRGGLPFVRKGCRLTGALGEAGRCDVVVKASDEEPGSLVFLLSPSDEDA